ncbi:hypothetical protein OIU85_001577 [Salix viminalis]|uniref:Glutamyl-tRNA reductase n=1 Tax=Salix viminalis TaxID=40686 RepID=A0A9Q0VMB4_SALVM|nr:hypothetical protein OIU85_001577 [Salix viminalis]
MAAAEAAAGFATSFAYYTQSNGNLRSQAVPCPQIRWDTFYKPLNSRRTSASNQRLCLKCESASQNLNSIDKEESKRSNVIALEQLKASAFDRYTKEKSSIIVIGLNVHTAPVDNGNICVALSRHRGVKEVTEWMSKISGVPVSELCQHRFMLYNKDATRHLFEVASGLDSIVLGEGQILAQVKQVKKLGQGVAGFNRKIGGLFEHAIITGKRVRTETSISSGSVSVSSAAVELALTKLPDSSYATVRVLVIGAGKMGKLVIKHLAANGCKEMVVVNRTEEKVAVIREELKDIQIVYKPLSEMMGCAAEADSTCKALPADTEMARRLFIDISVPRNVEPCVSDLGTAEVYNVDNLKDVVAANKEDRLRKAMEAQAIISKELQNFEAWKDSLDAVPTIKKLRAYLERIRASELDKCLSKMGDITDKQKKTIYDLSMGMMKKFLHGPMQQLRCDRRSDCQKPEEMLEIMHAVNRMFDLETEIILETVRTKMERTKK